MKIKARLGTTGAAVFLAFAVPHADAQQGTDVLLAQSAAPGGGNPLETPSADGGRNSRKLTLSTKDPAGERVPSRFDLSTGLDTGRGLDTGTGLGLGGGLDTGTGTGNFEFGTGRLEKEKSRSRRAVRRR